MSLPPVQLPESMNGLTTNPKLHLYTASTPNGYKVSVLLEELLLTYPEIAHSTLSYDFRFLSFDAKHQKLPQFLDINPNGRIPALVDDNLVNAEGEGHKVFESASVMLWLVERYDKDYVFWFKDEVERSIAMSWIYFIHGGLGPMQGQAHHFVRYAPEKIQYGIKRYIDETKRLYSVLEGQLNTGKGEWLVGDKYSIVDMNAFGWVRRHSWAGIDDMSAYPTLTAWIDRIEARPGAHAGLGVPERKKVILTKQEEEEDAKKNAKWVMPK